MSDVLREIETAGVLAYNGNEDFFAFMENWRRQGRRRWKSHCIHLPADEVIVPLVPVHMGRLPGHARGA